MSLAQKERGFPANRLQYDPLLATGLTPAQTLGHTLLPLSTEMFTRTASTPRKSPLKNAKKAKSAKPAEPRLSRTRRPPELETVDWQTALRRRFGREQNFKLENLGQEPVFSDFRVTNPVTRMGYSVAIRGLALGHNACTCLDYATNDLGTCKHIEFTLAKLQAAMAPEAPVSPVQPTAAPVAKRAPSSTALRPTW